MLTHDVGVVFENAKGHASEMARGVTKEGDSPDLNSAVANDSAHEVFINRTLWLL